VNKNNNTFLGNEAGIADYACDYGGLWAVLRAD
jgi:hypothetical protein